MKKSAAFTLIELLVVIVIIAILAGIALPVFSRVLEKGRATQDLSNLRQLGIGTIAYINDNNDTFFNATSQAQGQSGNTLGPPALLEVNYVPNAKVFQSPFDKRIGSGEPAPLSYGVNSNMLAPANANPVWDSNYTKLVAASQLIMYAPAYNNSNATDPSAETWIGMDNVGLAVPAGGQGGSVTMTAGTHQNYKWINALFADGHVTSIKFTDFQTTTDKSTSGGINGVYEWQPLGPANTGTGGTGGSGGGS